eukprot:Awhi_evm1s10020
MVEDLQINKIKKCKSSLVKIAWIRNWFQKWADDSFLGNYDLVLSASDFGKRFLEEQQQQRPFSKSCFKHSHDNLTNVKEIIFDEVDIANDFKIVDDGIDQKHDDPEVPIRVLRIATGFEFSDRSRIANDINNNGRADEDALDYAFIGSYFDVPRMITEFDPSKVNYVGKIYGKNWVRAKTMPSFKRIYQGPLPYNQIPKVYRTALIIIDDANHVTGPYGSVNSRVFDAIASGALVLTNGEIGALEIFDGELPVYHDSQELEKLLNYYLAHPREREKKVRRLSELIALKHTYKTRAQEVFDILHNEKMLKKIAYKNNNYYDKTRPENNRNQIEILHRKKQPSSNENSWAIHELAAFNSEDILDTNEAFYSEKSRIRRKFGGLSKVVTDFVTCMIVKVDFAQTPSLERLLLSLKNQELFRKGNYLNVYLANTDKTIHTNLFLQKIVKKIGYFNMLNSGVKVNIVDFSNENINRNTFGYDHLDIVSHRLLQSGSCNYYMFVDADSYFANNWYLTMYPKLVYARHLVTWGYVNHQQENQISNPKNPGGGSGGVVPGKVHLGTFIVSREALLKARVSFLQEGPFTQNFWSIDFEFVNHIKNSINIYQLATVPKPLLYRKETTHQ